MGMKVSRTRGKEGPRGLSCLTGTVGALSSLWLFLFNKVSVSEFNDFCMILVAPAKPIHSSQDLISLLHLDTLYNTYVRPFADLPGDEGQPGAGADGNDAFQRGKKKGTSMPGRKKMEKGYQHLIEDCIGELYHIIRHHDSHTLRKNRRNVLMRCW